MAPLSLPTLLGSLQNHGVRIEYIPAPVEDKIAKQEAEPEPRAKLHVAWPLDPPVPAHLRQAFEAQVEEIKDLLREHSQRRAPIWPLIGGSLPDQPFFPLE